MMPFGGVVRPTGARSGVRIESSDDGTHCPSSSSLGKKLCRDTAKNTAVKSALAGSGAVNLADLVFVDETGSNLSMTRRYARALKGDRAYSDAPYAATT